MAEPTLTLADQDDPVLRDVIYANFAAHSTPLGLQGDFRLLTIRVEREGTLLGGLMGRTGRGWLSVDLLALPPGAQGDGLGGRLMAMAEREAMHRRCTNAVLYTMAFQAPGFYEKLGYHEFARLEHDDKRLDRIYLRKRLA